MVSSFAVTGLIYISDRQLAGELSRVEWSRGTTNCEQINKKLTYKKRNHTECKFRVVCTTGSNIKGVLTALEPLSRTP